jgi:nucleotide-binding universal stress UspA family protein
MSAYQLGEISFSKIVVAIDGSGLKKLMLGSVASDIVTYAHCPVLVVK